MVEPHAPRWRLIVAVVVLLPLAGGCFGPVLPADLSCAGELICPPGFFCDPTSLVCRRLGGGTDAAPGADAAASSFCDNSLIELCLEFENSIEDGSSGPRQAVATREPMYSGGIRGSGILFDGTYEVRIAPYREGTQEETAEFWMTVNAGLDAQVVLSSTAEFTVRTSNSVIEVSSGSDSAATNSLSSGLHHLAISIAGNSVSLYIDGAPFDLISFDDVDSAPDLTLGSRGEIDSYVGIVDQLRIWRRALSSDDIDAIFTAQ